MQCTRSCSHMDLSTLTAVAIFSSGGTLKQMWLQESKNRIKGLTLRSHETQGTQQRAESSYNGSTSLPAVGSNTVVLSHRSVHFSSIMWTGTWSLHWPEPKSISHCQSLVRRTLCLYINNSPHTEFHQHYWILIFKVSRKRTAAVWSISYHEEVL